MVNLDLFESNIRCISDFCRAHGKAWRPHAKGHKCPAIARILVDNGAVGVTVAKLGEAEVMARAGIHSILVANQVGELDESRAGSDVVV